MRDEGKSRPEKDFILNFAKNAEQYLAEFLPGCHKTAFNGSASYQGDEIWEVKIPISNSLAAGLPFLPDNLQKTCADKYQKEIEELKNKFGHDAKDWPCDTEKYFNKENVFVFLIKVESVTIEKIRFTMCFSFVSPDFFAIIKDYGEKLAEKNCHYTWSIGTYEERLNSDCQFLRAYLEAWAYSPDVWQTARDRRIEQITYEIQNYMVDAMETSPIYSHVAFIPKKCFVYLFWDILGVIDGYLTNNKIVAEECDKIKSSWKLPSNQPVMMVKIDNGKSGEGIKVKCYMPMPYDPAIYADFNKFLENSEKYKILFETVVHDSEFASEEIISNFIGKIGKSVDLCALNITEKVITAYGLWDCVSGFSKSLMFPDIL